MAQLAEKRQAASRPSIRRLQWLWAAGVLLALLVGLWSVPPVRAAILDFLQIGAVRIWLGEPTPTPTSAPTHSSRGARPEATPAPALTPRPFFDLAGRTTLEEAAEQAGFDIPLPTYPAGLGPPDEVFYQEMNGPVVVLVWMRSDLPDQAAYSLHILGDGVTAQKGSPPVVMTTTVNGNRAVWTEGPYLLVYQAGEGAADQWEMRYMISGRVLIWEEEGLTYRLESDLSLEQAVRMAESLEHTSPAQE
jgi:hypothetical protein